MKAKLLAGCSAAAFCLTVGIAAAQQVQFSELDTNADKNLSVEEYTAGLDKTKIFSLYDTNADGSIDQAEFQTATDTTFKADMDANKFDKARYGDFAKWDKNSDGKLDKSELSAGLYAYYNTDADAAVMTESEFSAGSSIYTPN
jgi:Ca2+-binding EF-hand superfamily protein